MSRRANKRPTGRYAYEHAERVLETYALTRYERGHLSFYRAYRKLRCLLAVYAHTDFPEEAPAAQRWAWTWEDLDIAFRGLGENLMTGALIQLWMYTPDEEEAQFQAAIIEAFAAANEATDASVPRRYCRTDREAPVRRGEDDFLLPQALPVRGPRLREWAFEEGLDALELEQQLCILEAEEREIEARNKAIENTPDQRLPAGWRLLDGGIEH